MKIAIFHNFMDNIGGAEIVSLTLSRELGADFYTTNIDEEKIRKMGFNDLKIKSIGQVPINPPLKQQMALWRFSRLNLKNQYDFFIISGDWAISAAKHNQPNLWYVHSPMREIWDLYGYTRNQLVPWFGRWCFDGWVKYNRYLSKKYFKSVNQIVCNSANTQNRVKKYLGRDAEVINPMVDAAKFFYRQKCQMLLNWK